MTEAQRMLHEAHKRYQRRLDGPERKFIREATDDEIAGANAKRASHSIHMPMGARTIVPGPATRMSQAMIDHFSLRYYEVFCEHDKLKLEACRKCGRKGIVG